MANNIVFRSIKEESRNDPKCLTHVLTDGSTYSVNPKPKSRMDLEIFEKLRNGEHVGYKPHSFINETALSLVPWSLDTWQTSPFGCLSPQARGVIYFNERFYDRICSPEVEPGVLIELLKITYTITGRQTQAEFPVLTFDDYFSDLDISQGKLESLIRTVNGVPTAEYIENKKVTEHLDGGGSAYDQLHRAIYSIMGLRHGKPTKEMRQFREKHTIVEKPFEYASLKADADSDQGIRAFELTGEGDLRSLLYGIEDIKYFI